MGIERQRHTIVFLLTLITAGAVSACGGNAQSPPVGGPQPLISPQPGPVVVATRNIAGLGPVLVDGRGYTLYIFPTDTDHSTSCSDACLGSWPPVTVPAGQNPRAGNEIQQQLLGTISGPYGKKIATYAGRPLYAYAGDVEPGQANGQGLNLNGDSWFVINPDGKALVPPDQQGVMPEGAYLVADARHAGKPTDDIEYERRTPVTDHHETDTADPRPRPTQPNRPAINRRAILLGGVGIGGLAVGAGVTVGAQHAFASQPTAPVVPATEELMTDHGLLKRILLIYRECSHRLTTGDHLDPAALFHSAQMVHSYIEDFHEGIEEGYVFPRLLRAGKLRDTVRTLLIQHDVGRKLTIAIIRSTTTMDMSGMGSAPGFATADSRAALAGTLDRFITMYEPHEAREDTVVFPAFREVTADGHTFDGISEQIAHAQQQRFGDHGVSSYLDQIADIERQLGIHDLAAFTPATPG